MICPMMMKTLLFLPLRLLLLTRMGKAVAARAEAWQQAEGMFARARLVVSKTVEEGGGSVTEE